MHEIQINIVQSQFLETRVQGLLDPFLIRVPQLGRDEEIVSLHRSRCQCLLYPCADFVFVQVASRRVDVSVSYRDGIADGFFDFAWCRLPCSWSSLVANFAKKKKKRSNIPSPTAGISAPVLSLNFKSPMAIVIVNGNQ